MKIKNIMMALLVIAVLVFAWYLSSYLEIRERYNVNFNDCLMDYAGDFCGNQSLHLNDINLLSKDIEFICLNTKTKERYIFNFPENILNKCYGVS